MSLVKASHFGYACFQRGGEGAVPPQASKEQKQGISSTKDYQILPQFCQLEIGMRVSTPVEYVDLYKHRIRLIVIIVRFSNNQVQIKDILIYKVFDVNILR